MVDNAWLGKKERMSNSPLLFPSKRSNKYQKIWSLSALLQPLFGIHDSIRDTVLHCSHNLVAVGIRNVVDTRSTTELKCDISTRQPLPTNTNQYTISVLSLSIM